MKKFIRLSFKKRLFACLLLISLIPTLLIGSFSYVTTYKNTIRSYENSLSFALKAISQTLTAGFADFRTDCIKIILDPEIVHSFERSDFVSGKGTFTKALYQSNLFANVYTIDFINKNGQAITIAGAQNGGESTALESAPYAGQCQDSTGRFAGAPYILGRDTIIPYVCPVRSVSDGQTKGRYLGVMVVNVPEATVQKLIRDYFTNEAMVYQVDDIQLTGKQGLIFSSMDKNRIGRTSGSQEYEKGSRPDRKLEVRQVGMQFDITGYVSRSEVTAASNAIVVTTLIIIILAAAVCILLSILISNNISRPLIQLARATDSIHEVEGMHFTDVVDHTSRDEIQHLQNSFQAMLVRLKQSIRENEQTHRQYLLAEYKALVSQINPHFLYNTFSSVIYLIENGQKEESIQMLTALSELFRSNVRNENRFIRIREELEYTRNYLTIQQMRYSHFRFILDVDLQLMDLYMIKLTLQPLVENAIYHGLRKKDGYGLILLKGFFKGDRVIFEVKDNANMAVPEELERINECLRNARPLGTHHGIGLENVNNRIKFHFGREYGITLVTKDQFTISHMEIPVKKIDLEVEVNASHTDLR